MGLQSCDVQMDRYALEVKTRQTYPDWLKEMIAQTERNAASLGKVAILVLHQVGKRYATDDWVLMRISDWKALIDEHTS